MDGKLLASAKARLEQRVSANEAEQRRRADIEAFRKIYPDAETVFLTTAAENMYLSSSLVKQVGKLGGDISDFVPACILSDITNKFRKE